MRSQKRGPSVDQMGVSVFGVSNRAAAVAGGSVTVLRCHGAHPHPVSAQLQETSCHGLTGEPAQGSGTVDPNADVAHNPCDGSATLMHQGAGSASSSPLTPATAKLDVHNAPHNSLSCSCDSYSLPNV